MKSLRQITSERLDDVMCLVRKTPIDMNLVANDIKAEAEHLIDRIIKAFGNCEKCYGKGYGTATEYMQSFPDFGDEETFDVKMPVVRFCTCPRGEQLRKLVSAGKVAP